MNLTVRQAERLVKVLNFDGIENIQIDGQDRIALYIAKRREMSISKFTKTIYDNLESINDIEELRRLMKSLTQNCSDKYHYFVDSMRTKIMSKIEKMQKETKRKNNKLPNNLEWIIEGIAKGDLDIEKAKLAIQAEAKRFVLENEQNKFTLNEEQKSRQYIYKIRNVIAKNGMEFKIENPITSIEMYGKLTENIKEGIIAITKNLIAKRDYQTAEEIFNHYSSDEYEECTTQLKREIIRAKLGSFVLNGIKKGVPEDKEEEFFRTINKLITDGYVDIKLVPLGKNRDGSREITLADIWVNEFNIGR